MKTCSRKSHEDIKADPVHWENETTKIAVTNDVDEYGRIITQDWRNCSDCKSTLVIEIIEIEDARLEHKEHDYHENHGSY